MERTRNNDESRCDTMANQWLKDAVFYEILAEELSRRDMEYPDITDDNYDEIIGRMDRYMEEFRQSGLDKLVLED
jgi:hypothetical protein